MRKHEQPARAIQESITDLRCSVYGLFSTEDGVVRYIGQTIQSLQSRLTQHLAEAVRPPGTSRCHRWIRKVLGSGYKIGTLLIEEGCQWDEGERRWIAFYRESHPGRLTNLSDGGCGYSGPRSEETRQKMRKPKSEVCRAKMRKPKTPETRAKMSLSLRGNKRSAGEASSTAVLNERDVIEIKARLRNGDKLTSIADAYGVQKSAISKIKLGRTWRHL